MKKKLNKRILSAVLAIVTFLSCCPVISLASGDFAITHEGKPITRISVDRHEKLEVIAESIPEGTYQWQIEIPGADLWVDIQGQSSATLGLSYALVGSLLDGDTATVRCAAVSGGEEIAYSTQLRVTIVDKPEEKIEESPFVPVIVGPAEPATEAPTAAPTEAVTEPATEAPTEAATEAPTEAATEAPTEAATEAPTEADTEAPTEAATEAPTEVATEAPTEAATEAPTEAATEAPTEAATEVPTEAATEAPTEAATEAPTEAPTEPRRFMMFAAAPRNTDATEDPGENQAETEDVNIVSITVEYTYFDQNNNPVDDFDWPPYVAKIQAGSNYNQTIQIKEIPGYTATLQAAYEGVTLSGNQIKLNLTEVEESVTFVVVYQTKPVEYRVRRFLQNVNNDLYTEAPALDDDVFFGYPGDTPNTSEIYKEDQYPGFTALFYQPDTIAADGSTVFEVYYDRNYHLINFELDGGFGVSPVYARYETKYSVPTPTKPGYSFGGWKLVKEGNPEGEAIQNLSGTVPAYNQMYRATWTHADTQYSIDYWILDDNNTPDDTTDDSRYFLGGIKVSAQTGASTLGGENQLNNLSQYNGTTDMFCTNTASDHEHEAGRCYVDPVDLRYIDFVRADNSKTVAGDGSTTVNVYYEYRQYTLRFYYARTQGGTDSNGNGVPDTGFTNVQIPGGTTWPFGYYNGYSTDTSDDETLLKRVGTWGEITAFPTLKRNENVYERNTLTADDGWDYHYVAFTARYGDDISGLWPCDVFNSATRSSVPDTEVWKNATAVVSAWNGEHRVKYTQSNGNPTIKGMYERLDENLLIDTSKKDINGINWTDDNTVSYLCFWENGASGVKWNVPELYVYNIWLPCLQNKAENAPVDPVTNQKKETRQLTSTVNGKEEKIWFYLEQSYHTCDDSTIGAQTFPSLTGYEPRENQWGTIFISQTSLEGDNTYKGTGNSPGSYDSKTKMVYSGDWSVAQELEISGPTDGKYLVYMKDYQTIYGADVNPSVYREAYYRDFYYDANYPRIYYKNHGENMGDGSGAEVPYGTELTKYGLYFSKEDMETKYYPENLEPNAYEFAGWYRSDSFQDDAAMDWSGTMPGSSITVYAYWKPKTYDVTFYMDYDDYVDGTSVHYSVNDTSHGKVMEGLDNSKILPSKGGDYAFVRWVYEDAAGNKQSFEPTQMPVTQDLKLYAEWRSTQISEYTVYYVLGEEQPDGTIVEKLDDKGNKTYLTTAPVTGYAVVGTTKTVQAKTRDMLDALPEGQEDSAWFPSTSSHSILIKENKDQNVFEFLYITKNGKVKFTVQYLDKQTGQPVHEAETFETNAAEETVSFKYVAGYVPDAVTKRLVLSADESQNVIVFYYTKEDPGTAAYQVNHWLMGTDGKSFPVDDCIQEIFTGTVGTNVTAEIRSMEGFTLVEGSITVGGETYANVQSGTITSGENDDPLVLNLYYKRNQMTYKVYYKDQDTSEEIISSTSRNALYGAYVTETAPSTVDRPELVDYDLISDDVQYRTIGTDPNQNKITFWYKKKDVDIQYIAKCSDPNLTDFGFLNSSSDFGTIHHGSTATPRSGFYFAGWYSDEACSHRVEENATIDPNSLITSGIYEYKFYALFKPYELTISQTGVKDGDSAMYEVVNGSGVVVARVMLTGNSSVTIQQITPGEYTVREISGNWTWTYSDNPAVKEGENASTSSISVKVGEDKKTVVFTQVFAGTCWLHSESRK